MKEGKVAKAVGGWEIDSGRWYCWVELMRASTFLTGGGMVQKWLWGLMKIPTLDS